jgi:hypothetical protein
MVGVSYNVSETVNLSKVEISLSLAVMSGYIRENVVKDVRDAILNLFSFNNVSFGGSVSLGTLYRAILSVSGVDYTNITQFTTSGTPSVIDSYTGNFQGVKALDNNLLYIATDGLPQFTTVTGGIVGSEV